MTPDQEPGPVCAATRKADAIQRFFNRPVFLSATIGIPFCIFKLLFGITAFRLGLLEESGLSLLGGAIVVWATADLFMNASRSFLDLVGRKAPFEFCTLAQLGRIINRPLVFLAFDTFITFSIICAMLWSGWITRLDSTEQILWYAATTLNLVSLSLVILYNEIRNS